MSANTLDSRRFFRLDMPVYCYVVPRNRIPGCEIFATSAKYRHAQRELMAKAKLEEVEAWLHKIEDNVELVKVLYKDIVKRVAFFNELMDLLQQGKAPFRLDAYDRSFAMAKAENEHLEAYQANSPKSYAFFKAVENKIRIYLNEIHFLGRASDSRELACRHQLFKMQVQADANLKILQNERFDSLPLPRFIRAMTEYVNINLSAFSAFQQDAVIRRFPTLWSKEKVNLSEGGVRLEQDKLLRVGETVCFAFYSDSYQSVIGLKGSVIACQPIKGSERYSMSINFDFPDREKQMTIQKIMNLYEIAESVDWV